MVSVGRGALFCIYMVVFIDFMQLTFLFPLLPKIVQTRPKVPWCSEEMQIGLLGSVAAIGEGVAAPYLGALADRVGRRPVFLVAIIGCAICSIMTGLTETYEWLLLARLLAGICGGTASVAAAYIADVTEPEERASYMTYFQAALFGGLSFGPAIGGALDSAFGLMAACGCSAAICAVNAVLVFFFLPESKSTAERAAIQEQGAELKLPCNAYIIFIANFLNGIGFTAFEALGALYIESSYFSLTAAGDLVDTNDLTPSERTTMIETAKNFFSIVICGIGVVGMIVNLFLYNRIFGCTGLKGAIAFGGFFSVISFTAIGIPIHKYWFFFWVQVIVFGENIMGTSVQTVITCVVHPSMFGKALGTMTLFQNIARAIGPFVFSPLFGMDMGSVALGNGNLQWAHSLPWFINSFLKLAAILLCLYVPLLKQEAPEAPEEGAAAGASESFVAPLPTGSPGQARSGVPRVASLEQGVKRAMSRTTSGSYRTGGMASVQRTTSGTPQKQALLQTDFREQSLQPVPGDQIAPEAAAANW